MTMLSFLLGLWIGGMVGVVVMCLVRVSHDADAETYDG